MDNIFQKAKRRITEFSFKKQSMTNGNTPHVALVSKDQGGPANGYETLLFKAMDNVAKPSEIEMLKAEVTIEASFVDFLKRWMGLWYDDAQLLAKLLGFEYNENEWNEDWLESELSGITLIKSAADALRDNKLEEYIKGMSDFDFIEMLVAKSQAETLFNINGDATHKEVEKASDIKLEESKNMEELETLKAKLAGFEAEKEELLKAKAELEELKRAKDEAETKVAQEFVEGLSFVEEGQRDELVKALRSDAGELIKAVLTKAHEAVKAVEDVVGEGGETEVKSPSAQSAVDEVLKARYGQK